MSKIKKADLLQLVQEQADMVVELARMVKMNKLSIIKLKNESEQQKPKQLTRSVFDGLDERWRFAAVDDDGRAYAFMRKPEIDETDPCFIDGDATRCKWAGEGYDASNWQNSLIKREKKELTGSELCRAMLGRSNEYVMCLVGDECEESAKNSERVRVICSRGADYFDDTTEGMWYFAIPINNQGEPLTASEVGL